jgi:transcription elongation factor S-II
MSEQEDVIRNQARTMLSKVLLLDSNEKDGANTSEDPDTIFLKKTIDNLEKGIFNWSVQYAKRHNVMHEWGNIYFETIYKNKLRTIYVNMQKNPTLAQNIMDKTCLAHELAFMSHMEMDPELWKDIIQQWEFAKQREKESTVESMTDAFECRKCHSRKTTYYQMQTRSADEPMTVFVSCLECGTRWKC